MNHQLFPVLKDDFGIRPNGKPDQCFYCKKSVGQLHKSDCTVIVRSIVYRVLHKGREIGTYRASEPAHWTNEDCEAHLTDSSWCKVNLDGSPHFKGDTVKLQQILSHGCGCGEIIFRVAERGETIKRANDTDE